MLSRGRAFDQGCWGASFPQGHGGPRPRFLRCRDVRRSRVRSSPCVLEAAVGRRMKKSFPALHSGGGV